MKKVEAQELAPIKSELIMEYISQILSDDEKVSGNMNFYHAKIDGQNMCTLDIYVPSKNFEKHLNLGITSDHSLVLFEQVLNDLLNFLPHDSIGVTKYYSYKSMQDYFSGVNAINSMGSELRINFNTTHPDFMNLINNYTNKYDEFVKNMNKQGPVK